MAKARTATSWFPARTVESRVKRGVKEYREKAGIAPICRCEKPVTHRDLDNHATCIYCGK